MKIITNSRIFFFIPQSEPLAFNRPLFLTLDVPNESVLNPFEAAMHQLEQDNELWRVDFLCISPVTFEWALMQCLITAEHLLAAVETDEFIKIKYRFDSISGCWELRIVENEALQGIWGDGRLLVPIYWGVWKKLFTAFGGEFLWMPLLQVFS